MDSKLGKKFIEICKENEYSPKDIDIFITAFNFSKKYLKNELRRNNDPAIKHNLYIGLNLVKSKTKYTTICAGLLYGIHLKAKKEELIKEFGNEITKIIFGQEKLKNIKSKNQFSKTNPVRQIILTTLEDARIIFVKLSAKLNNLHNMECIETKEQKRIATEAIEMYAPIANRLGLELLKHELVDISFKIINLKKYKEIEKFLKDSKTERKEYVKKMTKKINDLLKNEIEVIKIKGREKQIYSIYQKIVKRKVPLHEQKDHIAIRIIVNAKEDCYNAMFIIKKNYETLRGVNRDYIKSPKPNGYQSLHTILKTKDKKIVEIQIRTKKMDEDAEEGVASHNAYKGIIENKKFEKKASWIKEIMLREKSDGLGELKINLFKNKIYCYTPQGEAIKLDIDSTVLDFAYMVHDEIGNKAVAGMVNKKFSSLKSTLKNGDIVEIITSKFQRSRRGWLKFVVMKKSKKTISKMVKAFENIPVPKITRTTIKDEYSIENPVEVIGFPNHISFFANCCRPIPCEKIIGVVRSHKKIIIHCKNCSRIKESKKYQVDANWKEFLSSPIRMITQAKERSGIMADILNTISRLGYKIKEASGKMIGNNSVECSFIVEVDSGIEIEEIIKKIKNIEGIKRVFIASE